MESMTTQRAQKIAAACRNPHVFCGATNQDLRCARALLAAQARQDDVRAIDAEQARRKQALAALFGELARIGQ